MGLCCVFAGVLPLFAGLYSFLASHSIFATIGITFIAYHLLNLSQAIWKIINTFFLSSPVNFKQKYGSWAVITGATDGIGKAYAEALSKKHGMNVVLISRTQSKLDEVAKELPTETKTIAVDFSVMDEAAFKRIEECLEGLDVGVLINNVGMGYDHPEYYQKLTDERISQMIVINCFAQAKLTKLALTGMESRKRGCIISLSSFSALAPLPLMGLYGATKEYNRFLSESIRMETKHTTMQVVQPYFVTTKLSKIRKPSLLIPTPAKFVEDALKTVGRYNVTFGCLPHQVYGGAARWLVNSPLGFIYNNITEGHMRGVMKRAYKKKEAQAKSN
jgi:17beta-estradiol 17-dehydrogenase / very-long-chain 3-oxoacyl-CoA reductase